MFSEMLRELDEIASASSASPSCSIHSRVFILQRASAASTDTVRLFRLFRPERRADRYTAGSWKVCRRHRRVQARVCSYRRKCVGSSSLALLTAKLSLADTFSFVPDFDKISTELHRLAKADLVAGDGPSLLIDYVAERTAFVRAVFEVRLFPSLFIARSCIPQVGQLLRDGLAAAVEGAKAEAIAVRERTKGVIRARQAS